MITHRAKQSLALLGSSLLMVVTAVGFGTVATLAQSTRVDDEAVAIVNGEPISKTQLLRMLGGVQVPPGSEQRAYDAALSDLIGLKLLEQFLNRAQVVAPAAEVKKVEDQYRAELSKSGSSFESALADRNTTPAELREMIAQTLRWRTFVTNRATDAELRKYLQENLEVFSGAQVRASHILLRVEPDASTAEKEAVREKLLSIRKEIEEGKISFPDAANKYSQDDGNVEQPSGGDLGFFPRRGVYIESFAKSAFALKKGEISAPVETDYGMHLILVTDTKPGQNVDFEAMKDEILNQYASDLQTQIIEAERKNAKIEIKPMPEGLFRALPIEGGPAPAPGSAPAGKPAT